MAIGSRSRRSSRWAPYPAQKSLRPCVSRSPRFPLPRSLWHRCHTPAGGCGSCSVWLRPSSLSLCALKLVPIHQRSLRRAGACRPAGPTLSLDYLRDHARADRAAALADREAQPLVHRDRLDQLDLHLDVVTRHDHLDALGKAGDAGHVGRAEVELRPVAREEGCVTATLLLLEDVDLGVELGVRRDRAGLAKHLAALDLLALGAAQQAADVVARAPFVQDLAEHLHTGHNRLRGRADADDLDLLTGLDHALLDPARRDGAATGDREDVLDRHQEGLVQLAHRLGDVGVQRLRKLEDLLTVLLVAFQRLQSGARDERDLIAREV